MDEVVLPDCQLGLWVALPFPRERGRMRDDFFAVDALNGNPSP